MLLDHRLWGVVLLQAFGIFSCVGGEIARIQNRSSKLGDFLDTLTDRVTELLLVGAIALSLAKRVDPASALTAGFALLGGVFVLCRSDTDPQDETCNKLCKLSSPAARWRS